MSRIAILIILILFVMSACGQVATPLPSPTGTATPRPTETVSLSDDERTAVATFIRTLPPSFTPTFTPTITATPTTTYTPTATFTPSPVPEEVLCEDFSIGIVGRDGPMDIYMENEMQIYIPHTSVVIDVEITNLTTGEIVSDGTMSGGQSVRFSFRPDRFPDIGEYEWVLSLSDGNRNGMCERRGTFSTTPEELGTTMPEMSPEVTVESPETTPEATLTQEATMTPVPFPPR